VVEGEDAEMTKTVNQAAAELEAEIGAQYPTHPGTNASDPVFQAQLAAATIARHDDRRTARPDPRYVAARTGRRPMGKSFHATRQSRSDNISRWPGRQWHLSPERHSRVSTSFRRSFRNLK
jgi:hypothetical protein